MTPENNEPDTSTTVTVDVYDAVYEAAVDEGLDPAELKIGVEKITDMGDITLSISENTDP